MMTDRAVFVAAARALDEVFVSHVNAGALDTLVDTYYAEDARVLPPHVPAVQGRGQIRELFREMLEAGLGHVTRETLPLSVAGDLGYGVGSYTCATGQPGREPVRDTGKYLLVYRRQADGSWKVAVDMFSSDLPPADRA
jgi:ketosteroid isomerase-like protein